MCPQTYKTYSLEKYQGIGSRHTCPKCGRAHCFVLYVDEGGHSLSPTVGRCDHESSCGYHRTPGDYFRDHPEMSQRWNAGDRPPVVSKPVQTRAPCLLPLDMVSKTVTRQTPCDFISFLLTLFPDLVVEGVINEYQIGRTKAGDVIFWQLDTDGKCRTGKVMKYNPQTGKRVKDEGTPGRITWIHSILKARGMIPPEWELSQCLFGEHLLRARPGAEVHIVESEKTAVICAAVMPQYIWLATGGKGQINARFDVLRGRRAVLYPDVDGFEEWTKKAAARFDLNLIVSDYIQKRATETDRQNHIDLADLIIEKLSRRRQGEAATVRQVPESRSEPLSTVIDQPTREALETLCQGREAAPVVAFAEEFGLMVTSVPGSYYQTKLV